MLFTGLAVKQFIHKMKQENAARRKPRSILKMTYDRMQQFVRNQQRKVKL
jgi:hypothetical protein